MNPFIILGLIGLVCLIVLIRIVHVGRKEADKNQRIYDRYTNDKKP